MLNPFKIKAFEYLSHRFISWYKAIHREEEGNVELEFSKLKLLKLLFFACAASTEERDKDDLLEVFDNFYAMPYGHVESDVYSNLSQIRTFNFKKNSIEILGKEDDVDIEPEMKEKLDQAVNILRSKNENLVSYEAMDLVELSHTYESWISLYDLAQQMQKYSMSIPNDLIRNELKYFSLN